MTKIDFASGAEVGAIGSAMIGTFFYTDTLWTEVILLLTLILAIYIEWEQVGGKA